MLSLHAAEADLASWTGGGPDLAWVTALASRGPGEPIYAGTYGGGAFVSYDGGLSWEDFSSPALAPTVIWELEPATNQNGPVLYAATEFSGLFRWEQINGLWGSLNTGLNDGGLLGIRGVEAHGSQGNLLTVATSKGVWTSHNYGFAWPDSNRWLPGSTFEDVEVSPRAPNTIFALESFSLFKTADKGTTYQDLGAGLPFHFNRDLELFDGSLDTLLVATLEDGLFASVGGAAFQRIGPNPDPATPIRSYDLEIEESSGTLLLGTARGLHVSPDLGQSWTRHNGRSELTNLPEIWSILELDDAPTELLLGSFRYGVLRTGLALDDWIEQNDGLQAAWVTGVHSWAGNVLVSTAHGRVFRSSDNGASWSEATGDLDAIQQNDIHRIPSTGRWLVPSNQGLWLSDDEGQSWAQPTLAPIAPILRDVVHAPWEVDTSLYLTSSRGVWRSVDGGDSWSLVGNGLPDLKNYLAAGVAGEDESLFFAANGESIYRSVSGSSFVPLSSAQFGERSYRALAFPTNTGDLMAVGGTGELRLWKIEEDGTVRLRMHMEFGLPAAAGGSGPDVEALAFDHASGTLYAGLAGEGVWRSFDLGKSWFEFSDGIRVGRVTDLHLDESARRLYASTFGAGVYGVDLAGAQTLAQKSTFSLRLAAANPARAQSSLLLRLSSPRDVEVEVIDLRGRRVRTLQAGPLPAGEHSLRWNLRDDRGISVANGVYWLRASDGETQLSRAVTVVR